MDNPIRVTGTREVYRGNLVQLREDFVVLPQGTAAVYERVEIKHGASTLAMEDNGDVWLVKEWKYAVGRPSIEVVSGGIEVGEAPLAAAKRELREEAGLTARERSPEKVQYWIEQRWPEVKKTLGAGKLGSSSKTNPDSPSSPRSRRRGRHVA